MYFEDREQDYELVEKLREYFNENPEVDIIEVPRLVEGIDYNVLTSTWSTEILTSHPLVISRVHLNNMTDREAADFLSLNGSYTLQ